MVVLLGTLSISKIIKPPEPDSISYSDSAQAATLPFQAIAVESLKKYVSSLPFAPIRFKLVRLTQAREVLIRSLTMLQLVNFLEEHSQIHLTHQSGNLHSRSYERNLQTTSIMKHLIFERACHLPCNEICDCIYSDRHPSNRGSRKLLPEGRKRLRAQQRPWKTLANPPTSSHAVCVWGRRTLPNLSDPKTPSQTQI